MGVLFIFVFNHRREKRLLLKEFKLWYAVKFIY